MMKRLIGAYALLACSTLVCAACVTQISPFDEGVSGSGGSSGGEGVVGTPSVAVVSSSSGVASVCGSFEDLGDCTADTTSLDPVDLAGAEHSVVGNWSRCGDTSTGSFDGGIRFQANGRVYRLYRGPNSSGSTEYLLYCGNDQSDGGAWGMENAAGTTQGEFVLTVSWDDGATTAYDLELYEGLSRLGLFEDPETQTPEVFAPAGAAIDL